MPERSDLRGGIRRYAQAMGSFAFSKIVEDLELNRESAKTAMTALLESGELKRIAHGVYAWVEPRRAPEGEVEGRIWAAMRINPTFTTRDIALQAGSTESYVTKRVRAYRDAGLVAQAGRKSSGGSGSLKIWRLTGKARAELSAPRLDAHEPDPLVLDVVNLNRLICTGLATRFGPRRDEAAALAERILTGLRGLAFGGEDEGAASNREAEEEVGPRAGANGA